MSGRLLIYALFLTPRQADFHCPDRNLGACAKAEFGQDAAYKTFDGSFPHDERLSNLTVRSTLDDGRRSPPSPPRQPAILLFGSLEWCRGSPLWNQSARAAYKIVA